MHRPLRPDELCKCQGVGTIPRRCIYCHIAGTQYLPAETFRALLVRELDCLSRSSACFALACKMPYVWGAKESGAGTLQASLSLI